MGGDARCSQQVPHRMVEVLAVTGIIQSLVQSLLVDSGTEKPFAFPSPSVEPH